MRAKLIIMFSLLILTVSISGQTNNLRNELRNLKKDTSLMDKIRSKRHISHFNEIQSPSEIITGRTNNQIPDLYYNRRFMHPEVKNIFRPGYVVVNGIRKYSLIHDNMPCLVPDKKGKLIIIKTESGMNFL